LIVTYLLLMLGCLKLHCHGVLCLDGLHLKLSLSHLCLLLTQMIYD
jgi:hypothetical protein